MGNKAPQEKKRDRSLVLDAKNGTTISCQKLDNDEEAAKKRAQSNKPRRGKTKREVGKEDVQHMPMFNIKKFVEEKGEIEKELQNTPGSKARRQMLENKWQSDDTFAALVKPLQVEKDETGMIKPKRFEAASQSNSPPRKKYTVTVTSKNNSGLPTINNNSPDTKKIEQEILQEDSEDENDVEKLIEKELKNDSYNITVNGKKGSPASGQKRGSKRFKQYGSFEEGDTPSRNALNINVIQPQTQINNTPSTMNVALSNQEFKLPPIMSHSVSKEQFQAQDAHLEESGVLRDYQSKFEHTYNGTQGQNSKEENSLGLNGLGSSYLSPQRFMSPGNLHAPQSSLSNFSMKPQFNDQSQTVNVSPNGAKHLRYSSQDMSQTVHQNNLKNIICSSQRVDNGKQTFDLYNRNQHLRQPQKFYSSAMVTGEQQTQDNQTQEEWDRRQNQSKISQNPGLEARQSPTKVQLQERLKQQKQELKHRDSDVTKLIKEIEARNFQK